jgi:hypothetical protein
MIELAEGHDLQASGAAQRLARVVEAFLARETPPIEDRITH